MAHFAQLDAQNQVVQVIVVANSVITDENGQEREELGIAFCQQLYGSDTRWLQTSYTHSRRHQMACIGGYYDATNDRFVGPQPFPSWILSETLEWLPPKPYPNPEDYPDKLWSWKESALDWEFVDK